MYVRASLSRTVAMFDLTNPAVPAPLATVEVVAESLSDTVALGRILFHRSRAPVHSRSGYVACASCHPDGGHDGQTWDFTHAGEGLRNTIDLRGRGGTASGPLHWSGNFDEVQDFENDIVDQFGGSGLADDGAAPNAPLGAPNAGRSAQLDALAAYVASLDAAPLSPHRAADGSHTERALRGREVFHRAGCARCHAGARFTDSTLTQPYRVHDVGTLTPGSGQRLGAPLVGIDTPSLLGAWASAPYLHDGSAATLLDVLARNERDQHGVSSTLDADERADLVAYLLELDRAEPELEAPSGTGGCGCVIVVVGPRQRRDGAALFSVGLFAIVVRRCRRAPQAAPNRRRKTA
jgi:cytochrome c peroxidase